MKRFWLIPLISPAIPALAHVGPEAPDRHFVEHLLIALVVAIPLGYGLYRHLRRQ